MEIFETNAVAIIDLCLQKLRRILSMHANTLGKDLPIIEKTLEDIQQTNDNQIEWLKYLQERGVKTPKSYSTFIWEKRSHENKD
jgi:hypothetical protein